MNIHDDTDNTAFDLEDRIVAQLEARSEQLDPAIQMRLDRARRRALSAHHESRTQFNPWPWLTSAGAAGLAVVMVIGLNQPPAIEPPATVDLDVLTLSEFDLLDQDPEFMTWLAEQDADRLIDDSERPPEGSS